MQSIYYLVNGDCNPPYTVLSYLRRIMNFRSPETILKTYAVRMNCYSAIQIIVVSVYIKTLDIIGVSARTKRKLSAPFEFRNPIVCSFLSF